jgi:DNA-binding protein HU-beta
MMTKLQLISTLSADTGLTLKQAQDALDVLGYIATDSLRKGQSVKLPSIGTIEARETPARIARNPRTGAEVLVPAKTRAAFYASATLKKHLNP